MINYLLIGQRVREIRQRQEITQEQLAEMVDVSSTYISCIERSAKKPSLEVLVQISNALGITIDELLTGNQFNNPTEYLTDMDELIALCSVNEKRLVYELSNSVIRILRDNAWII